MSGTYYMNSGGIIGERADLGYLVSPWRDRFMGPDGQYVCLRAFGNLTVSRAGRVGWPLKLNYNDPDLVITKQRYTRLPGENTPEAGHSGVYIVNVTPLEHGQAEIWDDTDELVNDMLQSPGGSLSVDALMLEKALARTHQAVDYTILTALTAATSPFTGAADVAAGTTWATGATATPIANIASIKSNADAADINSVVLERNYLESFRAIAELTTRFGGNVGAGTLSDDLVRTAWASFGITNVFACDKNSPLTNKAIFYALHSSRNPQSGHCGIVLARQTMPGSGADAIAPSVMKLDHHKYSTYAPVKVDLIVDVDGGCRLTGI